MSISASTAAPSAPRAPHDPGRGGFTLIEIMVTLALVGLTLLPLLELRQTASNMAYKSGHMLQAMTYGQRLLAERLTDPERLKERQGVIEEDPAYRYEISLEDFDLSTGRVEEEEDEQGEFSEDTSFSTDSAFTPGDAATNVDESMENEAYKVRRVKVTIYYPALAGDEEERFVLEGYVPRAIDPEAESLLKGNG
jgi:prepilin-type N-terminal cleavage/methylation domain-containing protein